MCGSKIVYQRVVQEIFTMRENHHGNQLRNGCSKEIDGEIMTENRFDFYNDHQ